MTHPEDTASKLADYEAMRETMLGFLWSLCAGKYIIPVMVDKMLENIALATDWEMRCSMDRSFFTLIGKDRPAAQQAIDYHFAEYIAQLKGK